MSTAVTMQDLELETAELLPSRETLNCWRSSHSSGGTTINQVGVGNAVQSAQGGGFLSPAININVL